MDESGCRFVTINCPNHHHVLTSGLWNYFTSQYAVDFEIRWQGKTLRTHQLIADVFLSPLRLCLLDLNHGEPGHHPDRGHSLDSLLEFMYTGQVTVEEEQVTSLLEIARELDFQLLIDAIQTSRTPGANTISTNDAHGEKVHAKEDRQSCRSVPDNLERSNCKIDVAQTPKNRKIETVSTTDVHGEKIRAVEDQRSYEFTNSEQQNGKVDALQTSRYPGEKTVLTNDVLGVKVCAAQDQESCKNDTTKTEQLHDKVVHRQSQNCTIRSTDTVWANPWLENSFSDQDTHRELRYQAANGYESGGKTTTGDKNNNNTGDVTTTKPVRKTPERKTAKNEKEDDKKKRAIPTTYKCDFCSYETAARTLFQVHRAKKHDPSIQVHTCPACRRAFVSEGSLQRHRCSQRPKPARLQCPHCDYTGTNRWWYRAHVARHDPSIPVFRCDLCSRKYLSQTALDRHLGSHPAYQCKLCSFQAPKKSGYLRHLFKEHGVNGKGQPLAVVGCDRCEFVCRTQAQLGIHTVAKHSQHRPFRCDHPRCSFSSGYKADVRKHVRVTHLGIKPCLCELCGFCTVSQSKLDKHQRSHRPRPRPYFCDVCGDTFEEIGQLEKHALVHNEKPFACHACGNGFSRREYLKAHLKNVHQIKLTLELSRTGVLKTPI